MKEHVHKYERRRLGSFKKTGHEVYKCAVPGCTHYMVDLNLVVNRYSQCWGVLPSLEPCKNEVEMTRYLVFSEKRKRPLCDECKERNKQKRADRKEELTEELIQERMRAIERLMEGQDAQIYDE